MMGTRKTNSLNALWNQVDNDIESKVLNGKPSNANEGNGEAKATTSKVSEGKRNLQKNRVTQKSVVAKAQDCKQQSIVKKIGNGNRPSWNTNRCNYPKDEQRNKSAIKNNLLHQRKGNVVKQINEDGSHLSKHEPFAIKNVLPRENDNAPHFKRGFKSMPLYKLQTLVKKGTSEILLTIVDKESGFSMLLNQEIKRDSMAYVLLALGKAVDCYMNNNVTEMILSVTSNSNFFLVKLQQYLVSFQMHTSEEYHLSSLLSLSDFLHKFQITLPSNAADILLIILPLLKQTCEKYLVDHDKLYCAVSQKLQEIEEQNSLVLKKYNAVEIKQASHKEKLQLMKPPEDYRSIPVLPNAGDILQACTFLRPNIVKGKYEDTDHYLDVQYRLLREDYVRPLRDGIAEYLKLKSQGKSVKHCKDVRVYSDVHIVKEEFINGGLVHMAYFKDKNFSKVKWEYSKRFLSGSLLCFSSDDFATMLFASVARRDPKELNRGLLLLQFEEKIDEVLNISPLRNFVVIETSAYFEAYRHNLNALLELNEANLPMKQYIVETQKNTQKPLYLSESTTYDMRPLLLPLNSENIRVKINNLRTHTSEKAKSVNILSENCWPTSSELSLDQSQYAALKAAVTKEFAVIQGPPGTGKTFVGLRIAQLLLHNIEKWQSNSNQLPILVICYTNHALDQFLEGLLLFTKKLVRVGGRGNNETISQFQLNNLKKIIKTKREVPHYIFSNIRQKFDQLKCLKRNIDRIQKSNEKCYRSVLSENILVNYMSSKHYSSLKSLGKYLKDDGFLLHDWLGIRIRDANSEYENVIINNHQPPMFDIIPRQMPQDIPLENYEGNEAEADIEYIEDQRAIIIDEFEGVSYDLPAYEDENEWVPVFQGEWQTQGGEKELRRYIINNLRNNHAMSEHEANTIQNVLGLQIEDRWRLYKFWIERYIKDIEKESLELQQELRKEHKKLCEMRTEEDIHVCKQAYVVGMTTTGAAKYRHIVQHLNPKILIVEEAAEILESHIVTSLAPGTQHVILIGDHQQLRPSPTVHLLAVKYDLNVSLFERMVENGMDCYRLGIQHRMRPEIAALISPHIYDNLQNHESVTKYESIKGVSKNVFFIAHAYNELQEYDSKSKVNEHEAKFIIKLCKYFIMQGYSSSQITVLTTYSGQLFELKRLSAQSILQGVKFTVVDNYQGEENDIVLISFVRSNEDGEIGFLKIANRVCVALSRAKKGLFCIGNFGLLAEKSELWQNIVDQLEKDDAIGPSLQLMCQNHPGVSSVVASENDFDSVPEGGCTRKCEFRLSCGHVCSLMCHPYDKEHEEVQCQKPCNIFCNEGHLCQRRCSQECGSCRVMVTKTLEVCGHTINVECCEKNEDTLCTKYCDKYLECGHMCINMCSQTCVSKCVEKIKVKSKVCGHKVSIECFDYENVELLNKNCREPCREELSCGHMCNGTCSRCHQGRLHVACNHPCMRILVCGHECQSPCSKSCPPCEHPCENRCIHSKCPKKCGEPCKKCTESCEWSCSHKKCSRLCGEPCDRTACDDPCLELLKCQHPCIGLCGEPCPVECRICHEEKVKEIFFGSEDEVDARFITLEDCKHIFETNGITQWMNHDIQEQREIQMKACPKCKVVIRKNLRFGNIVKSCLENIEKVKIITYGVAKLNIQSQKALLQRLKRAGLTWRLSLICKPLIEVLASGKSRSIQAVTTMENIINILLMLLKTTESNVVERTAQKCSDTVIQATLAKLKVYIKKTTKWLTIFIERSFLTATEQQLQEMTWEVHRLKLASNLLTCILNEPNNQSSSPLNALLESIITYVPFHEEEAEKFASEFKNYVKLIGGANINVTELEKQTILKAMGLSKGHWYQCPNGHVYCITECGGAVQESKCNECGEKIGGAQHTLLSTNRVATEMDGARHSAWSDAMNMENYRF